MDELDARAEGSDPFLPADRVEDEEVGSADDGGASRRAVRLEQLGFLATKTLSALVLIGAGALTMRLVSPAPRVQSEVDAPPPAVSEAALIEKETAYPDVEELLAGERDRVTVKKQRDGVKPQKKHVRVRLPLRGPGKGSSASEQATTPVDLGSEKTTSSNPDQTNEQKPAGPKAGSEKPRDEKKEKPEPAPKPDRNLYHVWKQGTPDHVYYWEAWKTVDYYAPQEYYLYRDGNGSEGSFFSEQVPGTIPLTTDDGPLGYVYESGGDGRVPLYYLRGPNNHRRRDLYTSDAATRAMFDESGWTDFGVVGYLGAPFQE